MNLDLRIPMGLMFTLVGAILAIQGAATMGSPIYDRSLGINVNLDWGLVLLVFGSLTYLLGRRGQKQAEREPRKPETGETARRGH